MNNVNAPLPARRSNPRRPKPSSMGSIDAPVTNVALPPIVANDPSTAEVTSGVSPAGAVTKPGSSGSARARSLRETLRSTGGFSTAIQTAELLDLPVGLRPSTR